MKNSKRILAVTIKRIVDNYADASYLEQENEKGELLFCTRLHEYHRGEFHFIGIRAEAEIGIGGHVTHTPINSKSGWIHTPGGYTCQTITSGGLWGIESDSDAAYLESVEQEELSDLKAQLLALGFSKRAIATAFKTVEHKEA